MEPDLIVLTQIADELRQVQMRSDRETPTNISAIKFTFSEHHFILSVNVDDDTLEWGSDEDFESYPIQLDASIWTPFISRSPWNFWEMNNHKGYFDAF